MNAPTGDDDAKPDFGVRTANSTLGSMKSSTPSDADQRQAFARRHHGPAPLRLATQNRPRKTPRTH